MSLYGRGRLEGIFDPPRVLGAFPLDGKFRLSKRLMAYCLLVRAVSAAGAVESFLYPNPLYDKLGRGGPIGTAFRVVALVSALGDGFFAGVWWIRKREEVCRLMEEADWTFGCKGRTVRPRMRLVHALLLLSFATYSVSYYVFSGDGTPGQNLRIEFYNFLSRSCTLSFIGQFWDLLTLLGYSLRKSTRLYNEASVVSYSRLFALCRIVNELYEPQILFTITECFLQIILYLYILLHPMNPGMNPSNAWAFVLAANSLIPIVVIILACNRYTDEEKRFNLELRRRIMEDRTRMLVKNEKLKFHFSVGKETSFTACGYFTVDSSLFCSMISAATTYLVIVLQYAGGGEEKCKMSDIDETSTVTGLV